MTYDPHLDGTLGYFAVRRHQRIALLRAGKGSIGPRNEAEWLIWQMDAVPCRDDPSRPVKAQRVRQLVFEAARLTGQPVADLLGRGKRKRLARTRQAVAWVARQEWGYSLQTIARGLCRTDHTTARHAIQTMAGLQGRIGPSSQLVSQLTASARTLGLYSEAA